MSTAQYAAVSAVRPPAQLREAAVSARAAREEHALRAHCGGACATAAKSELGRTTSAEKDVGAAAIQGRAAAAAAAAAARPNTKRMNRFSSDSVHLRALVLTIRLD